MLVVQITMQEETPLQNRAGVFLRCLRLDHFLLQAFRFTYAILFPVLYFSPGSPFFLSI